MALIKKAAKKVTKAPIGSKKVATAKSKKVEVAEVKTKKAVAKASVKKIGTKAPMKKATKARAKKKVVLYSVPADFKPHFLMVSVSTEKDGLIASNVQATRYVGRYNPDADEKKMFDLGSYDQDTLRGITARLSAITFKTNSERIFSPNPKERVGVKGAHRLPASTVFNVLIRVASRKAEGCITARVVSVSQVAKKKLASGKVVTKNLALEKTDPVSRMIRRVGRILPAAFKTVLMPPKRTRGSRRTDEE